MISSSMKTSATEGNLSIGTLMYLRSKCDTEGCFWPSRYCFNTSSFSSNVIRWAKTPTGQHLMLVRTCQFQDKVLSEIVTAKGVTIKILGGNLGLFFFLMNDLVLWKASSRSLEINYTYPKYVINPFRLSWKNSFGSKPGKIKVHLIHDWKSKS